MKDILSILVMILLYVQCSAQQMPAPGNADTTIVYGLYVRPAIPRPINNCGAPVAPTIYIIDGVQPYPPIATIETPSWIAMDKPGHYTLFRSEIDHMPYTDINDIIATMGPGIYQCRRGDGISVYGSR